MRFVATVMFVFTLGLLVAAETPDFKSMLRERAERETAQHASDPLWNVPMTEDTRDMESYDATHYAIDVTLDFTQSSFSGTVVMDATVVADTMSVVTVNCANNVTVSRVTYGNGIMPFYTLGNEELQVRLGTTLHANDTFTLIFTYTGVPTRLNDGIKFRTHAGTPIVFSMVSPRGARKWWPCKDTPADKALLNITVTFPTGYTCASNGVNLSETDNNDGTHTSCWHELHPVATYLVSFAVTNYQVDESSYTYNSQTMPIRQYVYPETANQALSLFSPTNDMLDFFSSIYGTYPFLDEKYSHAVTTDLGAVAMEHQTCTSFDSSYLADSSSTYTVAHEMSHQWAGDCVSIASWVHVWLKEGFATYSEALWAEHLYGENGLENYMAGLDVGSTLDPALERNEDDTPSEIFNTVVYYKGGWTLHMLRAVMGDTEFFQAIRNYMTDFAYGNVTTADLENECEAVYGQSLSWFFNEWFTQDGRPGYKYALYRGESTNTTMLTLDGYTSGGTQPFTMPVSFNYAGQIFTETVNSGFQTFSLPVTGTDYTIDFDPQNVILDAGYTELTTTLEDIPTRDGKTYLTWHCDDSTVDGYYVYRAIFDGPFQLVTPDPITSSEYVDAGLTPGTECTYYVVPVQIDDQGHRYVGQESNRITTTAVNFTFDQGILLVDRSFDANPPYPGDADVDSFYHSLLPGQTVTDWDVATSGYPTLADLAHYSVVVWHKDDILQQAFATELYPLKAYLGAGGHLILSSWRGLGISETDRSAFGFTSAEFCTQPTMTGATGVNDYPALHVNTALLPNTNWSALPYGYHLSGVTHPIYTMNTLDPSDEWSGRVCGTEVVAGDSLRAVILGFPLYFMEPSDAQAFMSFALQRFSETSVDDPDTIVRHGLQIYPNPTTSYSRIAFDLPQNAPATVEIYNLRGQKVRKLITSNGDTHREMIWDGRTDHGTLAPSGVYLVKVKTAQWSANGKLLRLR